MTYKRNYVHIYMENGVEFGRESKFGKIDKYKGLFTLLPKKTLPKFGIAKILV